MDFISTKEASLKWGISAIRITILANEGRIPGAQRVGRAWLIPADAVRPAPKGRISRPAPEEDDSFSFPLYPIRPDWSKAKEAMLSRQQKRLLAAENAVLECRFEDARPLLEPILAAPEDIGTEIGALWSAGMCCIALNRPDDFSKFYLRLQMLLAKDFPHRDDLAIILDALKTYVETISFAAEKALALPDVHKQAVPWGCMLAGYAQMTREAMKPGSAEVTMMELNLRLLQTTASVFAVEMMHIYLMSIYSFRQNTEAAEKHAKAVVQLAYESRVYFPLISFYHYHVQLFAPVLEQYPPEFQNDCREQNAQYEKNFTAFVATLVRDGVISRLTDEDYPYIFAVLTDLPAAHLARKLGITYPTVKRRLEKLYDKFGVMNKEELKEFLHRHM